MSNSLNIFLHHFENDNEVARYATDLHQNKKVTELVFRNKESPTDHNPVLNWDPLLRELETHPVLEKIVINSLPVRPALMTLLCHQILAALQRNPNVQSVALVDIRFSRDFSEGVASCFLNNCTVAQSHISDLMISACYAENRTVVRSMATALRHNSHQIKSLHFLGSLPEVLCPILQSLAVPATSDSQSHLTKLVYRAEPWTWTRRKEIARDLERYLESDACSIQSLKLQCLALDRRSGTSHILRGLTRNKSISELAFDHCQIIKAERHEEDDPQEHAQHLAYCLRSMPANLTSLRFSACGDFFDYPVVSAALAEVIARPKSSLQSLDFEVYTVRRLIPFAAYQAFMTAVTKSNHLVSIPFAAYQALMTAVTKSNHLESLRINNFHGAASNGYFHALKDFIPLFKRVKELTVTMMSQSDALEEEKGRILGACKNNYSLRSVRFGVVCGLSSIDYNWFSNENRARLDFYLDRNQKLAEWTTDPKLVPAELWSYAVNLALKAGINPLYQSLMALSEQGAGLCQQSRTRKRPQKTEKEEEVDDDGPVTVQQEPIPVVSFAEAATAQQILLRYANQSNMDSQLVHSIERIGEQIHRQRCATRTASTEM